MEKIKVQKMFENLFYKFILKKAENLRSTSNSFRKKIN